jgi:hypothetical protein
MHVCGVIIEMTFVLDRIGSMEMPSLFIVILYISKCPFSLQKYFVLSSML